MFSLCRLKTTSNSSRCYSTFERLGVSSATSQKLKSQFNITKPTPAQEKFIPYIVKGKPDMIFKDRTGTGKTFGTALSLASLIGQRNPTNSIQSLYIVPNQELAYQISHWMKQLTDYPDQVQTLASPDDTLQHIPHTIVGTPGRLLQTIDSLPTNTLQRLVLDEADQALGLPKRYATQRQQYRRQQHPKPTELVLDQLRPRQTIVSSATLNRPLRFFLTHQKRWLDDPVYLNLEDVTTATTVQHHCLVVGEDTIRNIQTDKELIVTEKKGTFDDLDDRMIESIAVLNDLEQVRDGVLFVKHDMSVESLKKKLREYQVEAKDIKDYRQGDHGLWISTEFSARGIDIPDASHVFILGSPSTPSGYLHMAGRTGRLGLEGFRPGKVINLIREDGWTESKMKSMFDLLNIPVESYENVE